MSRIIGLIIVIIGTVICFLAKTILRKFRVIEASDGNILKVKTAGLLIAVVGALIVFLVQNS